MIDAYGASGAIVQFDPVDSMNNYIAIALIFITSAGLLPAADPDGFVEHMGLLMERGGSPRKLKGSETATTKATFKPPVEIIIEAKTDSTNLRMSYAANDVIFNWEGGR